MIRASRSSPPRKRRKDSEIFGQFRTLELRDSARLVAEGELARNTVNALIAASFRRNRADLQNVESGFITTLSGSANIRACSNLIPLQRPVIHPGLTPERFPNSRKKLSRKGSRFSLRPIGRTKCAKNQKEGAIAFADGRAKKTFASGRDGYLARPR